MGPRFVGAFLFLAFLSQTPVWAQQGSLGYKPLDPVVRRALYNRSDKAHGPTLAMLMKFQALPSAFDCRDKGWVIPMGDQGSCGSCYLYSTIYGTLTSSFVKAGYGKNDGSFVMSVQFGMDCHNFGGCNGGNGTEVIDWVVRNGWPAEKWVDLNGVQHSDYVGYEARSRTCREPAGAKRWKPASWGFVSASENRPASTDEIKTALFNYGPLNVALDAGGQFSNGTGTITSLGRSIDHEIELVGWDDAKDGGAFLLKNQWGKSWGNGGYRWVTYKAAQNLVDVFFVTAQPLPPPPPDPIPPGPGPAPSGASITLNADLKAGTYMLIAPDEALKLKALVDRLFPGVQCPPVVTPSVETKEPPMQKDQLLLDSLKKLNERLDKIEGKVVPGKK